jgi:hypothetical protein
VALQLAGGLRPSAAIDLWGKQSLNFVLGTTKGHRRKAGWRFGSAARLRRKPGLQAPEFDSSPSKKPFFEKSR